MYIETLTLDEWADALPASGCGWAHTPAVLRVLRVHTRGTLKLYGGFNGAELVGVCPLVEINAPVIRAFVSPPPGFAIPQLGPIVFPTSPKQRKREQVNRRFTNELLTDLAASSRRTLVGFACHPSYTDPRPYLWSDFDVATRFTYRLSLDGVDLAAFRQSFSRETRRAIGDARDAGIGIRRGGVGDAERIYRAHRARRNEQGDTFPVDWCYVRDLVQSLDDRLRVYVAEDDSGAFCSGLIVMYGGDEAYSFLGGTRSPDAVDGCNELLHWTVMEDICTDSALDSVTRYDFGNGNLERLAYYKSQYGATPVPRYVITSGKLLRLAKFLYDTVVY